MKLAGDYKWDTETDENGNVKDVFIYTGPLYKIEETKEAVAEQDTVSEKQGPSTADDLRNAEAEFMLLDAVGMAGYAASIRANKDAVRLIPDEDDH